MKDTVLLTGAAGYIGSVLTQYLLDDRFKVIAVDDLVYDNGLAVANYLGHPDYEFHEQDVRNIEEMRKWLSRADVIIPLAAIVGAPACKAHPRETLETNRLAIEDLVSWLSSNQRVVYPNSNSGYGATDGVRFCTENDPMTPLSLYAKTKCEAEEAVLSHGNAVSLRLATVFGSSPRPRFDLMVNDFVSRIWSGSIEIFEPHFKRNFVHIRDVCRAFVYAADSPCMDGAYNVGLPEANLSKLELAHLICQTLGVDTDVVKLGEGTDEDQRNYLVSSDRLLRSGFRFKHDLTTGIREVRDLFNSLTGNQAATMRNA